jgi:hypothetical protein
MKTPIIRQVRTLSFLAAAFVLLAVPAKSVVLVSLSPVSQTIGVGGTATVSLNISGLGNHASLSLGSWLADISYNGSIVTIGAGNVTFGSQLNIGAFGSLQFASSSAGLIHADETSFADAVDLNTGQPGSFTLATFTFTGVGPGTTQLGFTRMQLGDENGVDILDFGFNGASITVTGPAGSAPDGAATLPLVLGVGLMVLMARRRQVS